MFANARYDRCSEDNVIDSWSTFTREVVCPCERLPPCLLFKDTSMFHQFLVAEESLNSVLFPSLKWRPIPKNSQNSGSSRVCVCVCVSPSLFSHVFGRLQIGQKRNRMETEIESNQQIFFNQNTSRANSAILETPFLLFPPFFFNIKSYYLFPSVVEFCWLCAQ